MREQGAEGLGVRKEMEDWSWKEMQDGSKAKGQGRGSQVERRWRRRRRWRRLCGGGGGGARGNYGA